MKKKCFKLINQLILNLSIILFGLSLIHTMIGTAHYLALYTEFHNMASQILIFILVSIVLYFIYSVLEYFRRKGEKE